MKITLYPLPETDSGNRIASKPSAEIYWEEGSVLIRTDDKDLEERLKEFYSKPLSVRRAVSPREGVVGFKEVKIAPDTEEFFRESVYLIRMLNYYGKLEGERKTQVVALDFDGTLWDSVRECFIVTLKAYESLGWQIPHRENLEEKFKHGRFFVRTGDEFYLLLRWIGEHPDRDPAGMTPEEEETLRNAGENRFLFENKFYSIRQEMRDKHFEEWCALQAPYPGMLEQVRILQKKFARVVVATTKDADSVRRLLALHNIALEVIGKEKTVDKAKQMNIIASTYKTPLHQIIFVDDILEQVRVVKSLGVKAGMAGWGYGGARQKEEARKLNIPVFELENFAEKMLSLV